MNLLYSLQYRQYLKNHNKVFSIITPLFGILLIALLLTQNHAIGLKALECIGIILSIVASIHLFRNKNKTIDFYNDHLKFNGKDISYEDITDIKEINSDLVFYQDSQILFKINEYLYEPDDLIEVNKLLEKKNIYISDMTEKHALDSLEESIVGQYGFLVLSILSFIYIIAVLNGLSNNLFVCGIISLLLPLIIAAYYVYLLQANKLDQIVKHRAGFFVTLYIPVLMGWVCIYFKWSLGNVTPIVYASICIYLVIRIIYTLIRKLRGIGSDYVFKIFLVIYIPLTLVWFNSTTPISNPTIKTVEVASVNTQSTKLGMIYNFKYTTKSTKQKVTIDEESAAGQDMKKGGVITIPTKMLVIFNGTKEVTADKVVKSKTSSGDSYTIYYTDLEQTRIIISEEKAKSLKVGQKVKIKVTKGIFGVTDYSLYE